jgi:hypothetical protein
MVCENWNIEIFRYVLVTDIQRGIMAMQRHTNWLHHFHVPDAGSGSKPPNRVSISHQGINEQHIKQIPFPMDRTYILSPPQLRDGNLSSLTVHGRFNVFTITHIDLSCRWLAIQMPLKLQTLPIRRYHCSDLPQMPRKLIARLEDCSQRREDHSYPSIAEVKNKWNCTAITPYALMTSQRRM